MPGPLRLTYALLANYMAKCQMSSGPYGPIFNIGLKDCWSAGIKCLNVVIKHKGTEGKYILLFDVAPQFIEGTSI